jgi:hypothetical protein
MNIFVIGIIMILVSVIVVNVENVNAQQNNNTTGTTTLNFTKILAGKAFERCTPHTDYLGNVVNPPRLDCFPIVDVLYQGKKMLVLDSYYVDAIWKAVEIARENGYTIDGISNYATNTGGKTLVAMSK